MPNPTSDEILSRLPPPGPDEVRIVVLIGQGAFVAHESRARLDEVMDAFERRAGMTPAARTSRETHALVRIECARLLRAAGAEDRFREVVASAVLWLSLRHWSNGEAVLAGVDGLLEEGRHPVVTASIADVDPARTMPDTAWAFMVGEAVIDGRDRLEGLAPYIVQVEMDESRFGKMS